jgi:hypothetical protein
MNKKRRQKETWDHASLEWIHHARVQIYQTEKRRPLSDLTPRMSLEAAAMARRLKLKTIRAAELPKRRRQTA